jgi:hypothetical protein
MKKMTLLIIFLGVLAGSMFAGLALSRPRPVQAAAIAWVGAASGFWDDPLNWSPPDIPGPGDDVTIAPAGVPITVTVRISVTVGSLALAGPHALEIEAGSAVTITNGINLNGGNLAAAGSLRVDGASTWNSADESSIRGTFTNDGILAITGQNHRLHGTLTNNGTLNHQSGKFYLVADENESTTLNNSPDAVYDYKSDVTLSMACVSQHGMLTFNNDGTLIKSAGMGESAISSEGAGCVLAFNNNGAIDVQKGTLRFDLGFTSTGSINIAADTALNVTISLLNLQGGSLTGKGSYFGNLYNSGIINPGNSAGILTINGTYIQDSLGVIQIELGGLAPGAQFDQLKVNGNATLDGELRISYFNGFIPVAGNSFLIITYQSHTRNFKTVTGTLATAKLIVAQNNITLETWKPPVLLPVILKT